jgi:hypothetical protein
LSKTTKQTTIERGTVKKQKVKMPKYSIEFFHIYMDETIGPQHTASIDYLRKVQEAWSNHELTILLDDYNAKEKNITPDEILEFLDSRGVKPDFWAYESELVANSNILLDKITKPKLKDQYLRYISQRHKYPCSLLAASWYLTRLGKLDHEGVLRSPNGGNLNNFVPAGRLINILPLSFKPVEERILNLIANSEFSECKDKIQDLFYSSDANGIRKLF